MVLGKQEDQNSYQRGLIGQLRVISAIKIMEYILGSTTLMVNICKNIGALRQFKIHPEAVKLIWNRYNLSQVYLMFISQCTLACFW